jgi:hypothetical protein
MPISFCRFVADVLHVSLTRAQRVLGLVAFDGVEPCALDAGDREIARQIFGDVDVIPRAARSVLVGVIGARSGKSYVFEALYSLWRALTADLSTLAPGEIAVALIVAPDLRLARQTLRYALGAAKSVASIARRIESETSDGFTIQRPDGKLVSIECLPASRGGSALRGRSLVSAVLSEPAFLRDENYAIVDEDLFRAAAPRVLPGGLVVCIGTPWIQSGLLYKMFVRNHGSPVDAIAAHAPTLLMLPTERNREVVARERERDPDNAAREFDALFTAAGTALWFDPAALDAAIIRGAPIAVPPEPRQLAWQGGDLAFRQNSSAFVVARREGAHGILVADVLELRPTKNAPLQPSAVVALGVEQARRHRVTRMMTDEWYADSVREHLQGTGVALVAAPGGMTGKVATYTAVRSALHEGRLRIPAGHDRLLAQIRDTTSRPLPGGGIQIVQPKRGAAHGDLASAFVLAVYQAHGKGRLSVLAAIRHQSQIDPRWCDRAIDKWSGRWTGVR